MLTFFRRSRRPAVLALAALLTLSGGLMLAPEASASGTEHGCPLGDFCIYPGAGWNNSHPSAKYPSNFRGNDHVWYNLHGQIGTHRVFYNQASYGTDLYWTNLNKGHNGAGPISLSVDMGRSYDVNLTPINSITIWWYARTVTS